MTRHPAVERIRRNGIRLTYVMEVSSAFFAALAVFFACWAYLYNQPFWFVFQIVFFCFHAEIFMKQQRVRRIWEHMP